MRARRPHRLLLGKLTFSERIRVALAWSSQDRLLCRKRHLHMALQYIRVIQISGEFYEREGEHWPMHTHTLRERAALHTHSKCHFACVRLGNNSPQTASIRPTTTRSLQLKRATIRSKHDSPDRPLQQLSAKPEPAKTLLMRTSRYLG